MLILSPAHSGQHFYFGLLNTAVSFEARLNKYIRIRLLMPRAEARGSLLIVRPLWANWRRVSLFNFIMAS